MELSGAQRSCQLSCIKLDTHAISQLQPLHTWLHSDVEEKEQQHVRPKNYRALMCAVCGGIVPIMCQVVAVVP